MRFLAWIASLAIVGPGCRASADTPLSAPTGTWVAQCQALARADFSGIADAPTQVVSVKLVEATADLPARCQVRGYVAPSVGFDLQLPTTWNGKFLQVGCGGHCGDAQWPLSSSTCESALRKGYACLASDLGHKGTGADGLWGHENLQAKLDWGYRATHVATLAGKAIAQSFYAGRPKKAYFMGCSTGGRQALQEAQRFPWDFDGIIAVSPPIDLSTIYLSFAWAADALHDPTGQPLLRPEDLRLLTDAAVARCDPDDGAKDGIISDPMRCPFDPVQLSCKPGANGRCLTPAQIEAVQKVYEGPMNAKGDKLTPGGPLPGSELGWTSYLNPKGQFSGPHQLFTNGLRYLFFSSDPGPGWKLSDFDFDRDYQRLGLMQPLYDSSNPDLRRFEAAGGKIIAYQGLSDGVFARATIDYYEAVERTMGGRKATQDFFRLFLAPGVKHCSGGVGADAVDLLGYLEAWVEEGQAPDQLLGGHLREPPAALGYPYREFPNDFTQLKFTRPIYPYPLRAKYKGSGDVDDAGNFHAIAP